LKYIISNLQVNPLRVAWANLLNRYRFTWFATLTWRSSLPKSYTAINQTKKWIKVIEKAEKRDIGYFLCLEWTKFQNRPHIHLLMGNLEGIRRDKWWLFWFTKYGRVRILPYRQELGASYYLCKYVIKDIYYKATYEIKGLKGLDQLTLKELT